MFSKQAKNKGYFSILKLNYILNRIMWFHGVDHNTKYFPWGSFPLFWWALLEKMIWALNFSAKRIYTGLDILYRWIVKLFLFTFLNVDSLNWRWDPSQKIVWEPNFFILTSLKVISEKSSKKLLVKGIMGPRIKTFL